jgi:hypothetical protein
VNAGVPHVFPHRRVHHVLADVLRVIADALERLGDEEDIQAGGDRPRISLRGRAEPARRPHSGRAPRRPGLPASAGSFRNISALLHGIGGGNKTVIKNKTPMCRIALRGRFAWNPKD